MLYEVSFENGGEEELTVKDTISRIKNYIEGLDFENQDNYEELMNLAIDRAVRMRDVFKQYM